MKARVLITTHSQAPHGQVPQPPAFFVYSTPAIQASLQLGGTKTKNWGEDSLQLGALKLIRVTLSGNLFSNLLSKNSGFLLGIRSGWVAGDFPAIVSLPQGFDDTPSLFTSLWR